MTSCVGSCARAMRLMLGWPNSGGRCQSCSDWRALEVSSLSGLLRGMKPWSPEADVQSSRMSEANSRRTKKRQSSRIWTFSDAYVEPFLAPAVSRSTAC